MIMHLAIYSTIKKFSLRVLLSITLAFHSGLTSATPRNVVAGHLAASSRQVAFSVQEEQSIDIVVGDFESASVTELRSPGTRLIFPFLTPDGRRLLVVRQHPDNGVSDLLSCTTNNFHCRQLHTSKDAISSPIEIDEHRILFISSQLRTDGPNLRSKYLGFPVNRYVRHDIWRLDVGQAPRRVTDFELYELGHLCITANNVYFSGMGPRSDKPVIPKYKALQRPMSDIYRLPIDRTSGAISLPDVQLKPVFLQEGHTSSASVSADESLAALIRTTTNSPSGGYRYDLVVQDLRTGASRTIEPANRLGFSRPVFVGNAVLVSEIFNDRYIIKRMLPGEASIQPVLEISDGLIIHAPVIEIAVDQEAH
jgi:hypothetical protein